jgi:hypothetical protein
MNIRTGLRGQGSRVKNIRETFPKMIGDHKSTNGANKKRQHD